MGTPISINVDNGRSETERSYGFQLIFSHILPIIPNARENVVTVIAFGHLNNASLNVVVTLELYLPQAWLLTLL